MDPNICRVCLNKHAIISIFDREEDNIQYSIKIMRCVSIVISEEDEFPKKICAVCVSELCTAFRFVEKCDAADKTLRSLPPAPFVEYLPLDLKDEPHQDNIFDDNGDNQFLLDEIQLDFDQQVKQVIEAKQVIEMKQIIEEKQVIDEKKTVKKQMSLETESIPTKKKKVKRGKIGPVPCPICGHISACRSAMEAHVRVHNGEKPFSCNVCQMKFTTKGGMKRHIVNNHSKRERRFTCETCGNSFFTKSDIITHMRIHTDEKPFVCQVCSRPFRQLASLIRHKRTHTGEKPFPCPQCGKCFADKNLVRKHLYTHTDELNFTCHLCNKSVKTKTALKSHMELHTNMKRNICNFCGMAFAKKGNLKIHIERMHSEKSGHCDVCNQAFPDLEEHTRKHTGERPYVCIYCGSTYSTKRSLTHHVMFKHANADKFKCSVGNCMSSFPSQVMLEYHILKFHTNHTPYICPHCARGFYRNSDLSRHLKITHMK